MKARQVCKITTSDCEQVGSARIEDWIQVELFYSGDEYFKALENRIEGAVSHIYLESYIFAFDRLGVRVVDALGRAAQRGVDVRLIIDGVGSYTWIGKLVEEAKARGIALKVFKRLPWQRIYCWRRFSNLLWNFKQGLTQLNRRTHRKLCVIDGTQAFVGSMNIIECHCNEYMNGDAWRDTGVYVEGDEVGVLQRDFIRLWKKKDRRMMLKGRLRGRRRVLSGNRVKLNSRKNLREQNYLDLLVLLLGAQKRVWIETAYFVPDRRLVRALRTVAESGVDVRIMVPAQADVFFIPWVSSAFHRGLLQAGIRIFEYTKTMLHAKAILVDHYGVVGSSNLNHRSLFHDLEVDVHFTDRDAVDSLARQFLHDVTFCREIALDSWHHRPFLQRAIGSGLLLFRGVL